MTGLDTPIKGPSVSDDIASYATQRSSCLTRATLMHGARVVLWIIITTTISIISITIITMMNMTITITTIISIIYLYAYIFIITSIVCLSLVTFGIARPASSGGVHRNK